MDSPSPPDPDAPGSRCRAWVESSAVGLSRPDPNMEPGLGLRGLVSHAQPQLRLQSRHHSQRDRRYRDPRQAVLSLARLCANALHEQMEPRASSLEPRASRRASFETVPTSARSARERCGESSSITPASETPTSGREIESESHSAKARGRATGIGPSPRRARQGLGSVQRRRDRGDGRTPRRDPRRRIQPRWKENRLRRTRSSRTSL